MTRRWVPALVLLAISGGLFAVAAGSMAADERHSAFAGGDGATLVEEAEALGWDVQRLSSRPETLLHDPAADPHGTVLVVLGPQRPYTDAEAAAVADFVAAGGALWVADNFGHANSVTRQFGIVFERVRLVEPEPAWNASLDGRLYPFHLPDPTALRIASSAQAEVLAASSPASFTDRDGDGIIAAGDPAGPFPVLARLAHGDGQVVVLADPAPLAAASDADGRAWLRALLKTVPGDLLLVDESMSTQDPVLAALAAQRSAAAAMPWRAVVMAAAALALAGLFAPHVWRRWGRHVFRPHRFVRRAHLEEDTREVPPAGAAWTTRGVTAIVTAAALGLLALLHGSQEAAYASAMLLGVVGLAFHGRRPRLLAERTLSASRLDENANIEVSIEINGRSGNGECEFRDHLPSEFEVQEGANWFRAAPQRGRPLHVRYVASPSLRGPYAVGPLRVRWHDPLALRLHEADVAPGAPVRVNPRQEPVRQVPFRTRVPTITLGPHFVNRAGEGSEFHALRQYQTGDSFRSVNWKASARSKDLMVNQRVHESMTRLTIFLDARAISAAGPASSSPLAHGCRAVLSVGAGALRVRDRLRIVVYGDGVREVPPMPASRQLHELTDLLSSLPAAGETTFAQAVAATTATLKSGTPVMLASGLEDDETIEEGMKILRSRGMLPFVVSAPLGVEPVDPADGASEPDADALLTRRQETISSLQSMDIPVYDAVPGFPLDHIFRSGGGV